MPPARQTPLPRLWDLLRGGHIPQERLDADFEHMHRVDRRGDRFHVVFAMAWCFALACPMTWTEVAIGPLGITWLARQWYIARTTRWAFAQPVAIAALLWYLWMLVAMLWSPDRAQGWRELDNARFLGGILFLWPVIEYRRWLVGAWAAGFLVANATQLLNHLGWSGLVPGIEVRPPVISLDDRPLVERNGGWWEAIHMGQALVVVLAFHAAIAWRARDRWRWLGVAGLVATSLGILATGTRGAWIAGGVVLVASGALELARAPSARARRRAILIGSAFLLGLAGVVWASPTLRGRVSRSVQSIHAALNDPGEYSADGARVAMLGWSWRAIRESPLLGQGTGGYPAFVERAIPAGAGRDWFLRHRMNHGHNAPLHVWASQGLVGLAFAGLLVLAALGGAWSLSGQGASWVGLGAFWGVVGLAALGAFEVLWIPARSSCFTLGVLALCVARVPSGERPLRELWGAGRR